MNIAFYVSGNAGRLRKIVALDNPAIQQSTKLVFSDENTTDSIKGSVEALGATYRCLNFKDIPKPADTDGPARSLVMSNELLAALRQHEVDYCFSFGAHLLVGELLEVYRNKIINFHPSVLPAFPGLKSIDQALAADSNLLGNTAHFIDAGIDTGTIIMQSVASRQLFETGGYEAVLDMQLPMFTQIFNWLDAGRLRVDDGKVVIADAKYRKPAYFPALES